MICSRLHAFIRCSYYSFSIAKIMINAYGNMENMHTYSHYGLWCSIALVEL